MIITAKFASHCAACYQSNKRDRQIAPGQQIVSVARGVALHASCYERVARTEAQVVAETPSFWDAAEYLADWRERSDKLAALIAAAAPAAAQTAATTSRGGGEMGSFGGSQLAEDMGDFSGR